MKPRTVFLDAGGVLVHPNWARVRDTLARHGVTVSAEALRAADPQARFVIDRGLAAVASADAQHAWRYMNLTMAYAGIALNDRTRAAVEDLQAYHAAHNLWETVGPDVVPSLARLRHRGLRLVVVSNANGALARMFDRVGLTSTVDVICDSFVEGVEKPDPRFFEIALARSGGDAATTVHVGDLYQVDVIGARRAGLTALLLDTAGFYGDYDCDRVRSLPDAVDWVDARR